jgi:hypothetical protein
VNHRVRGDFTGGYIHVETENLRALMQVSSKFISRAAGLAPAPIEPSTAAANDEAWHRPSGNGRQTGRANTRSA